MNGILYRALIVYIIFYYLDTFFLKAYNKTIIITITSIFTSYYKSKNLPVFISYFDLSLSNSAYLYTKCAGYHEVWEYLKCQRLH